MLKQKCVYEKIITIKLNIKSGKIIGIGINVSKNTIKIKLCAEKMLHNEVPAIVFFLMSIKEINPLVKIPKTKIETYKNIQIDIISFLTCKILNDRLIR